MASSSVWYVTPQGFCIPTSYFGLMETRSPLVRGPCAKTSATQGMLKPSGSPFIFLSTRQYLVLVFAQRPLSDTMAWAQFITLSVETLLQIRNRNPPPLPELNSMARAAIDPAVCKKLINHIPLPVIDLFDQESTWQSLHDTLLGLADLCSLESTEDLRAWKVCIFMMEASI